MVTKLVFKGDKPKKRKNKTSEEKSKRHKQENDSTEPAEGWITAMDLKQLKGPVVVAISGSSSPVCLSADAQGKVYTSTDLDLYGEAKLAVDCIEPSNVQQVFVLGPLSFSDKKDQDLQLSSMQFSLKASHGRYLSADKSGVLEASSTSVGLHEIFTFEREKDRWSLKSSSDQYLSIVESESAKSGYEVRADSEAPFEVTLRVQAAFMPVVQQEKRDYIYLSSQQLEEQVGRMLKSAEIQRLKDANKAGKLNEALLDLRVKSKSDSRS
jgi:protein FRG1